MKEMGNDRVRLDSHRSVNLPLVCRINGTCSDSFGKQGVTYWMHHYHHFFFLFPSPLFTQPLLRIRLLFILTAIRDLIDGSAN